MTPQDIEQRIADLYHSESGDNDRKGLCEQLAYAEAKIDALEAAALAAATEKRELNYPELKYTVPDNEPPGTCAICFKQFKAGSQVYRDNAAGSFRCLSHGPASSPHHPILDQFDFSVAGMHLHDSPRPNYEFYDKAEWHTRGIKQGLKIARTILKEVLLAAAAPPPQKDAPPSALLQAREHLALAIEERLPHKHVELSIGVAEETLQAIDSTLAAPSVPAATQDAKK